MVYIARQLYDLQVGTRNGACSRLMDATVTNLTIMDILDIASYALRLDTCRRRTGQRPDAIARSSARPPLKLFSRP